MASLAAIEIGLADLRSRYNQAAGQLALLEKQRNDKTTEHTKAKVQIATWEQVQVLFSKVSEFAREQLKIRIEETVTAALQAVFCDDCLSFAIDIRTLNGKPAAEWSVVSRYGDMTVAGNPEDARGGGIADVVSLALRLALLELARPKPEGPVVLDEPGKMISREYLPNVAEFLKQYAAKTERQILMVTHAEPLAEAAHCSFRVTQLNGASEVSKVG